MEALRSWPQTSDMKEASVEILSAPASGIGVVEKRWTAVFADLVKARLTTLVLLTTLVGFYVGWRGPMNFALMLNTLAATALVAAGAAALDNGLGLRHKGIKPRKREDCRTNQSFNKSPSHAIKAGLSDLIAISLCTVSFCPLIKTR